MSYEECKPFCKDSDTCNARCPDYADKYIKHLQDLAFLDRGVRSLEETKKQMGVKTVEELVDKRIKQYGSLENYAKACEEGLE